MKIKTLEEILKKKSSKTEFAILTNLENGNSEIYIPGTSPEGEFSKYTNEKCETENCDKLDAEKYNINNKTFTKRTLCKIISRHYIKHLNLIAAIVSAVNPTNNICLMRLKKLLEVLETNKKKRCNKSM